MSGAPTRRALILGAAALPLGGCAAWVHAGRDVGPPARAATTGVGILIFETAAPVSPIPADFPFHCGAVIDAPSGRALYDPGGWWVDGLGQRVGDVTHGLTRAREEAYLRRDYFGSAPGDWRVHRFDRALDADEAAHLLTAAQTMAPVVFGLCAWALASVLKQAPTFADLRPWLLPGTLLTHLRTRPDLDYRTWVTP